MEDSNQTFWDGMLNEPLNFSTATSYDDASSDVLNSSFVTFRDESRFWIQRVSLFFLLFFFRGAVHSQIECTDFSDLCRFSGIFLFFPDFRDFPDFGVFFIFIFVFVFLGDFLDFFRIVRYANFAFNFNDRLPRK